MSYVHAQCVCCGKTRFVNSSMTVSHCSTCGTDNDVQAAINKYKNFIEKFDYRRKLYDVIEVADESNKLSRVYDIVMMITIIVSIIPLAFKETNNLFEVIDKSTVFVFVVDYILRFLTADYKLGRKGMSFVLYPLTPMALIDILSILPSVSVVNSGFRLLKVFRLLRTLKVLRIFKAVRYSNSIQMVIAVFKRTKESLMVVCGIAIGYTLISALVIFNVEPDTFNTFFDSIYWAAVSLTTMGYGDIYPVTVAGRIVTMISAFMGIAVVALPAGIITSGLMEELKSKSTKQEE